MAAESGDRFSAYVVILPRFGGHEFQLAFRSACSGVM